jgi:hypothetical protein
MDPTLRLFLILAMICLPQSVRAVEKFPPFDAVVNQTATSICLRDAAVQRELKLTEADLAAIRKISSTLEKDYYEQLKKIESKEPLTAREEQRKIAAASALQLDKLVVETLKPEQRTRLRQIGWQLRGSAALHDPEVQKALELTDAQKKKLLTARDEYERKMKRIKDLARGIGVKTFPGTDEPKPDPLDGVTPTMLRHEYETKMTGVLTADQRKKWTDLRGPAFPAKAK